MPGAVRPQPFLPCAKSRILLSSILEEVENRGVQTRARADLLFVCINLHIASQCFQFKIRLEVLPRDLQSLSLNRLIKSLLERNARDQDSSTSLLITMLKGFWVLLSFSVFSQLLLM